MQDQLTRDAETSDEKLFRLTEITWDTDGDEIEGLPDTLDVWAWDEESAMESASDEIGWCIEVCFIDAISEAVDDSDNHRS